MPDELSISEWEHAAGCSDPRAREEFRAAGLVPFELWDRERHWREELQGILGEVLNPGHQGTNHAGWPETPEAVDTGRQLIQAMLDKRDALEAELRDLRQQTDAAQMMLDGLSDPPAWDGDSMDHYVDRCRSHAVHRAIYAHGNASRAAKALGLTRKATIRWMERYGIPTQRQFAR